MIVSEFKELMLSKTTSRKTIPDDIRLYERIYTALKKVAVETIPMSLVVNSTDGYTILRTLDSVTFIRKPIKPTSLSDVIDIDEFLLDATALYVMAGLEKEKASVYMGMYNVEIESNEGRYIEADLVESTNENDFNNASNRFA